MNSETKFTPGPWYVYSRTLVKANVGNTVTDVRYKNGVNDAHLIAAAPDLYEALDSILALEDLGGLAKDMAIEALAKARGET